MNLIARLVAFWERQPKSEWHRHYPTELNEVFKKIRR